MNVNELRIGNYVLRDSYYPIQVESIIDYGINLRGGDSYGVYADEKLEDIKPIPLTEEWLLKFGFTKYSYGFQNKILIRHPHKDCYEIRISDNLGYLDIKYVHQLQNLYFALTHQELTLNKQIPC